MSPDLVPAAHPVDWSQGVWLNPPVSAEPTPEGGLRVQPGKGGDFWRQTSYGFVHDNGEALLAPLPVGQAVEVDFRLDFTGQFDQAGVLVRVDERNWVKTGVEFCDGLPQVGAVVTREMSDWSTAPVPGWTGRLVSVRVSRAGDALTVRARVDGEPWHLVRLAPLAPEATALAGPFCCAPTRDGLTVHFTAWRQGPADHDLHPTD
ncbi:hypothetical protein AWW66_04700 [Micromonospora rosaria]|uniref:Regulation of enolase 1 n=1 Tax=Micromonospora rosaria TaxID=47874 RepID=A0A136PXE3_9ACTN|nr:DUF1349 domain-containing protein [Micromonospora rosaria]KXK63092.1 hypothetical protein AWW66_04700 [Micromonospora rosaria]